MSPHMYVMGKALGNIFTAWRDFFFLFSAASRKVYNTLLMPVRRIIFLPPSKFCVRSFYCHYHVNRISASWGSEWRRLPLVPELNLLLRRPRIQWNTISFHLSSCGLVWDPKTRCKLSLGRKRNSCNESPVNCSEESPPLLNASQRAAIRPSAARNKQVF